jgi:lipopolysaccharide/colanic/teichoic acid biosynthesis glycosyltransferase/FlaA1/EpsC-like NDP-sugar epimerase
MEPTKRFVDIILSVIGIIIMIPLLPMIALLIKMDSKGPVFYHTDRIGKDMAKFKMYKFRTMVDSPIQVGQSVCPQYDPRVTFFGRFLRRTKLNELPQLLNILKGEMTFVGPRPEAPDLAKLYPENAKKVFSVKPGLVGPATILGRNEEECYPPGVDANFYYIENILPTKLKLDLEYINNPSFLKDFHYIYLGIKETIVGVINKKHLHDNRSQICLFLADLVLTIFSYIAVRGLYYGSLFEGINLIESYLFLVIIMPVRIILYAFFGLYNSLIRYISYHEIKGVFYACAISSFLLTFIAEITGLKVYSGLFVVYDSVFLIIALSGMRIALRFYWEKKRRMSEDSIRRRLLIYGADDFGYEAYCALSSNSLSPYETIGFIDDNTDKYGKSINGLKVLGNQHHIKELAKLYHVDSIIITGDNANSEKLAKIIKICQGSDVKCRIFLPINGCSSQNGKQAPIRRLELSDILPLKSIQADIITSKKLIKGKTILLNGSGGALGIELARKMLLLGCKRLIIVERYEAYLNEAVCTISKQIKKKNVISVLMNYNDIQSLENIFKKYCPDIVIQAAMRKYEPFLRIDHENTNQVNHDLTMNIAKLTVKSGAEIFTLISSLEKQNYGLSTIQNTVRKTEDSLFQYFSDKDTNLVISRLCDIAENRGGIVSVLEHQILNHNAVVLPSEKDKCCLITKSSAVEYILQCMADCIYDSNSNSVCVCNAGSSIMLIELAQRIAVYNGINPLSDLEISFVKQDDRIQKFVLQTT